MAIPFSFWNARPTSHHPHIIYPSTSPPPAHVPACRSSGAAKRIHSPRTVLTIRSRNPGESQSESKAKTSHAAGTTSVYLSVLLRAGVASHRHATLKGNRLSPGELRRGDLPICLDAHRVVGALRHEKNTSSSVTWWQLVLFVTRTRTTATVRLLFQNTCFLGVPIETFAGLTCPREKFKHAAAPLALVATRSDVKK